MALAAAAVAYPWLHPFARGASASTEPLLVSLGCVAVLLLVRASLAQARLPRGVLVAALAAAAAIAWGDFIARGNAVPSPGAAAAWLVLGGMVACAAAASPVKDHARAFDMGTVLASGWLAAALLNTLIALAQFAGRADLLGSLAAASPLGQAFGNLRQKNHYASLAALGLVSLAWLSLRPQWRLPGWATLALAVLLGGGVAASASRMGAVQLFIAAAIAAAWYRAAGRSVRGPAIVVAAFACAAAGIAWVVGAASPAGPTLLRRLFGAEPDCPSRTVLWQNMLQLVAERPWTGWGWRELSFAFHSTPVEPRFCALVENAHNLPLHLAVELGLPVTLLLCVGIAWAIARAWPARGADPARQLAWSALLLLALHSLVEYPLWYGPFQMAVGLGLGVVLAGRTLAVPRPVLATFAVGFLALGSYIAWDLHRATQPFLPIAQRSAAYQDDTLARARASWLFSDHVAFAELMVTPLLPVTAHRLHELAGRVLHLSPEPRVIEKRIAAAQMLGRDEEAEMEKRRYRAAFPQAYEAWREQVGQPPAASR